MCDGSMSMEMTQEQVQVFEGSCPYDKFEEGQPVPRDDRCEPASAEWSFCKGCKRRY